MHTPCYKRYTSAYQQSGKTSPERKAFEAAVITSFLELFQEQEQQNIKVERIMFRDLLDQIGCLLQRYAAEATNAGSTHPLGRLLAANPVPSVATTVLTPEVRAFCLALNALKQWLSAEQGAMDRLLLGGNFREKLQKHVQTCAITTEPLSYTEKGKVNFHHAMRDGRFPIPLSKYGHDKLEKQLKAGE